jgi:23S rRNA pseudouridine1911/1915/1917 synthase
LSRVVAKDVPGSKLARLRYRLLDHLSGRSLLEVVLETGRRHQIRAQLAASGCPIIGDLQYGAQKPMAHGRIALLAHAFSFDHPTRKERVDLLCPEPVGWPWAAEGNGASRPLWSIETYENSTAGLPFEIHRPLSGDGFPCEGF